MHARIAGAWLTLCSSLRTSAWPYWILVLAPPAWGNGVHAGEW